METTETIREARRLTRPRDGRWLGGVAAGLGAYFDLNPAIYRIAFVALSLAGGTGILLYIAAWLVIPEEGEQDSIAAVALKRERDRPGRAVGLALLAFVGILVLGEASFWPDPGNVWLAAALAGAALVWWQVGGRTARPRGDAPAAGRAGAGDPPREPLPARRRRAARRRRRARAARRRRRLERRLAVRARRHGDRTRRGSSPRAPQPAARSAA